VFRRLAGERVVGDIQEFFGLISGLSGGFRARAKAVRELMQSERTRFLLITSASAPERNDIVGFVDVLRNDDMSFDGFVLNRVTQPLGLNRPFDASEVAPPIGVDRDDWDSWTDRLTALVKQHDAEARQHQLGAQRLSELGDGASVWSVPDLGDGVRNVAGLTKLAHWLPPLVAPGKPVSRN
jgi:hypothetical protein